MRVRLGFAVAAHLEPEIMMIDEVLAVGDAAFQTKCLGKMNDISRAGRTVLFVSHDMGAISRLCPRTCLLEAGRLVYDGPSPGAIQRYLGTIAENRTCRVDLRGHRGRRQLRVPPLGPAHGRGAARLSGDPRPGAQEVPGRALPAAGPQ